MFEISLDLIKNSEFIKDRILHYHSNDLVLSLVNLSSANISPLLFSTARLLLFTL